MAGLSLRGAAARVRWSYHVAAELGRFSIDPIRGKEASALRATVLSVDPYQAQQSPLVFELPGGAMRWALSNVVIADGVLTGQLSELQP